MKASMSIIAMLMQVVVPILAFTPFSGQHLVLVTYHYPPYDILIRHPDGNLTVAGSDGEIINWVMSKINLTYSILPVDDDRELIAKLGYYEAAYSKVISKQADAATPVYVVNPSRAARLDYTSGMAWLEPFNIVVPKPEFQSRLFAFIRPFQPTVWLGLLLSIIVMVVVMTLFAWIYIKFPQSVPVKKEKSERNNGEAASEIGNKKQLTRLISSVSYYFVFVMNILTNHGDYSPYSRHSFRILTGGLLLASLVLVNLYSSIVMSSLTVPIRNPAVNSLEDLVDNKDVSLIIQKNIVFGMIILNAETGLYKTLGDELRRHPDRMLMDYPSMVKYLEQGKYAYPFVSSFNRDIVAKQYRKEGKCRLQVSDPINVSTGSFHHLMQKGLKYREVWSHALMYLWETGLTRFWTIHLLASADVCFDKKPPKAADKPTPIKLVDLASAFLILGIGLGLGIICFISEIMQHRLCKRFRV